MFTVAAEHSWGDSQNSPDYTDQVDHRGHVLLPALGAQIFLFHLACLVDLCKKIQNKNLQGKPASLITKEG